MDRSTLSTTSPLAATPSRIHGAIAQAAHRTGVDFDYLYNQARIESSLNPAARAKTSSAAGLFQFTRQTWLQVVKTHGAAHGIGWAADAIARTGNGYSVADPALRDSIDRLRYDPALASTMAGAFAADNRDHLETALGRQTDDTDLYLAHFLGAKGAADFLTAHGADPDAAAAPLFPAAAAANRGIFFAPDGAARSLGEIRGRFAAKFDGSVPPLAPSAPVSVAEWSAARREVAASDARAPMRLAAIEPLPPALSLDFAARAYRRLQGIGA